LGKERVWNNGIMERWNDGERKTLEWWNDGIVEDCEKKEPGTME
jgi:hypothetical protein